jgi:hypothetical protein
MQGEGMKGRRTGQRPTYIWGSGLEQLLRASFMEVCKQFPSKQIFFLYPLIVLRTIPFPGDKELDKRISSGMAYPRV